MILEIRAFFECDKCGRKFSVQLDPAWQHPDDWSLAEYAVDAVACGKEYRSDDSKDLNLCCSTHEGRDYCGTCTEEQETEDSSRV